MTRHIRIPPGQAHDLEDREVDLEDPDVPAGIRAAAWARWQEGASLWRCPRASGPRGVLGLGQRHLVIEWWLLNADSGLIEAFWEEYE